MTKEGFALLGAIDWMHLLWRWKTQLLDPGTLWHLGPGIIASQATHLAK